MNEGFTDLQNNLIDVVKEQQIKLGYRKEIIRFYYPKSSLEHLLGLDTVSHEILKEHLISFADSCQEWFGRLQFSRVEDRYCILIPEQGTEYVHEQVKDREFLEEFIGVISRHGVTLEELLLVFHRHSDQVVVQKETHGEFDYLIYFADGVPDAYRYCVRFEEDHGIYHRFTLQDYEDFDF